MAGGDRNVGAKQLAYLFGVSERRIQQLANEGVVVKEARGRYNLIESVRGYVQYLQAVAQGTQGEKETDYGDARTQKMLADSHTAIMIAAKMAGDLVPVELVQFQWNHMVGAFRAKLLNLPKKAAPMVQNETTFVKCNAALQEAVHECLAELSEFRPDKRAAGQLESLASGSTTEPERRRVGGTNKKTVKRKQRRAG